MPATPSAISVLHHSQRAASLLFFFFLPLCKLQRLLNKPCQPVCEAAAVNGWWKPASNNSFPLINSVCISYHRKCGYRISCNLLQTSFVSEVPFEVTNTSHLSWQWSSGHSMLHKHNSREQVFKQPPRGKAFHLIFLTDEIVYKGVL